ncbi:MAG: ATP-binding cassette domain-containing protein [Gemmatimonadales bacterium]|nr:ATP-binding cassette domain-containing protein [Gemmatimonadales bacterium]
MLDDIHLEIPAEQVTAIVGPSGAGKTSLLRLLNRLDDPTGGEIRYRGWPLAGYPVRDLRRKVAFVFQTPVMFSGTVRENLRHAAHLTPRLDGGPGEMRTAMELAELDWALVDREGDRLSAGEKQRANIARALMTGPRVLLMDEPTSALDPETAVRLTRTIRLLSTERGLTVVIITHRLAEAWAVSDSTVVMEAGRVIETGLTAAIFARATSARTRAFLAGGQ